MIEKPFKQKVSTHTHATLDLKFKPTRKIIDDVKKVNPEIFLVAFRAEYKLSKQALIGSAHKRLSQAKADLIVVNDVGKKNTGFGTETNEVFIIDKDSRPIHVPLSHKREAASKILDVVNEKIRPK
jgi:phosphopantothenoylcysteine decarboxylase/phosphopantothenate--cysteine ligase